MGRLLRIGAAGVVVLAAGAASGACSLIVDTNGNQCSALSDCNSFAGFRSCKTGVCQAETSVPTCMQASDCSTFAQATCNLAAGVCTRPCTQDSDCGDASLNLTCGADGQCTSGTTTGCKVNADCTGAFVVCRKTKCVKLTSDLCSTVYGSKANAYQDDTAVIFGDILPTANNPDGSYGRLVEDSIKLALDDFGKADGIPGLTGANRPLVLIGCNDGVNEDQTDVVAHHLIDDIGVPAIIGYAFSGSTISVAQDVTIPAGVLLFSPSATSSQITAIEMEPSTHDLLWRTAPSDNVQAQALALFYGDVQAAATHRYPMIDPSHVKVAIVNHSDAYGSGLGDALQMKLMLNGKAATDPTNDGCAADAATPPHGPSDSTACYFRFDYGMSTSPDLSKIPDIVSFAPDVIFLFGFNEGPDQIFKLVESQWALPSDMHRPFWVFSDGGEVSSLWASSTMPAMAADIQSEDARERVIGSVPGTNGTSWPPYGTFLANFSQSSYSGDGSADTIGPAGAYDILYLLAYSTVLVGTQPLTGENLVKLGLQKLKNPNGTPEQIDRNNIIPTLTKLSAGASIDVTGVSGPLPFNGQGDITTADIQIWCVPPAPMGGKDVGAAAVDSQRYFASQTAKLTGCISATCNLPDYPVMMNCQ